MPAEAAAPEDEVVKVLVVDDMEQNLLAMEALLGRPGLVVLKAQGGPQALELLLQHEVALALLDVQMPDMDGFALAELMRGTERTRSVPIIFVTAGAQDRPLAFRGYDAGAVDFLYKPVEPLVLLAKVQVFVELWRQRREAVRRNAELERLVKLNETMAAVLTHDLRTPLSAIMVSAAVVQRLGDAQLKRVGERIQSSGARMARMIEQLLDFSRIRSGVLQVTPQPADLRTLAEAAVAELRQARPGAQIELQAEGGLAAQLDPDRIGQVLSNLLANAVQHGEAGEPVRVLLDGRQPDEVRLAVANGGHIPADVCQALFEPFRSGAGRESSGLGLGLYIVDQFVRAHGGRVMCRSGSAEGTVFEVRLPRRAPDKPADEAAG